MTSQGSAMTRFDRALTTGHPGRIVAAALELPRPIHLSHGVRVLLALRDAGADAEYRKSAAKFAARLVRQRSLNLADAQLLYSALAGLGGSEPKVGAAALEVVLRAHSEGLAAAHVQKWIEASGS